ncbi:MAG: carbohydrate porin [Verrucomicrobia bacterium]|nr:carbohydrate porin [Verrucomicrobiota bacterium]
MKLPTSLPWRSFFSAAVCSTLIATAAHAGTATTTVVEESSSSDSWLKTWWEGKYMTGNWFGLRDTLEDNGLTLGGKYEGAYFGVVDSAGGSRGFYDQQLTFTGDLNFGKLLKTEALEGVKAFGVVRWRDPRQASNPNQFVDASSMFNPSNWQSGTQWRMMSFGMEIGTANLLPVKDMIVLRGGWLQPNREFIDQPLSKLFSNNAINSGKGVGGNIPFSSSFSTWGGTLKIKPVEWHYAKAGLFMSYPQATASGNHGLAYQGYAPDTAQNGLFFMGETGFTPKIGESKLPGKYAFGGYYYEQQNNSYFGQSYNGRYGFYFQADQMVYREPSAEEPAPLGKGPSDGKSVVDGKDAKSFKAPVAAKPELSKQGLSLFNLISFAPKYNNLYPFYFQSGAVYTGLIPSRDEDQLAFAIGYGSYSFYNIQSLQDRGVVNQPNYSIVLEWDYRIQINKWAYFQPMAQYIIQPNGTGAVQNATVLGFTYGLTF